MCADLNSTLTAAQTYRAAARTALAVRLATRAIDAEQRAAHGFSWIATTVAALEATLAWFESGQDSNPLDARIATLAFAEGIGQRSEEHTSELQSLMRISYAVFCLKKKNKHT